MYPISFLISFELLLLEIYLATHCSHLSIVFLLVFLAMINTMTKTTWKWKVFFHFTVYIVHHKRSWIGIQGRNSRQAPKQRSWKTLLISLSSMACSAYFLSPFRTTYARHGGLGLPISIINQENAFSICLQAMWWGHFLSWGFLFSDGSVTAWQKQ